MTDWDDSTAFITGGAQGIGLGIARALARRGVRVAIADVDADALASAAAELGELTRVASYELDVRDRSRFASVADSVEAALGPVGLLFNNAGVAPILPLDQMEYEHWDWALGINLGGVVNGIQTFVPRMIARGRGGHVVNTSSGAGLIGTPGAYYATSKFAVVGLSESLRLDLAPLGISVSVLCPGPVDTGIVAHSRSLQSFEASSPVTQVAAEAASEFLRTGVTIDAVGELVLAGMDADALWIHTDPGMREHLEERHHALLASLTPVLADR